MSGFRVLAGIIIVISGLVGLANGGARGWLFFLIGLFLKIKKIMDGSDDKILFLKKLSTTLSSLFRFSHSNLVCCL